MNTKNVILAMAIATVFLIAAVGSASAININNCTVITTPGLYTITDNITNSTAGKCIDIQSDDVILDGQWHKIDGVIPGAGSMYGIYCLDESENRNNVTIKNVEVTHFYVGILAGAKYNDMLEACDYKVEDLTIENCTVHDNGASNAKVHAIEFKPCVWNSTINNCTVYNQLGKKGQTCEDGGAGIRLHTYCYYNNITNNTIHNNALVGIYSKMICRHNYVFNNDVYENGEDVPDTDSYFGGGIRLECINTDNWTVEYNTVTDNWGPGIHVRGKNCIFRYNEEKGSRNATTMRGDGSNTGVGDGFFACGVNQKLISNSFCNNTGEDIYISSSTTGDSDENTCDTTCSYNDNGATGCTYSCFKINGSAFKDGSPVDLDKVDISNREYTDKKWTATIDGDYYELFIGARKDPGGLDPDISPDEELLIVGCKEISTHEYNCNVTNHMVVQPDIDNGGITKDLTLNHYCLNYYPDYPYYTKEQSNWSGPAVMQACIGHYYAPGDVPTQAELNETGIANNTACNENLEYVDPYGMQWTLNRNWMWRIGRNYGLYSAANTTDGLNYMLHYTCYWQHLGPAPVPAYGDYSNWMAVRGIHTSENPYPQSQGSYDIYGFWINDPNDGAESIGENSYKTVDQWTDEYYHNLSGVSDCDNYQYKYVGLFEPPEQPDREVRLVPARPRFDGAITPMLAEEPMMMYGVKQLALEKVVKDDEMLKIVQAAIDGVNEELVPYDSEFAEVFAKTVPGKPMLVTSDNGDYYVVPFNVPVVEKQPVTKMPVELERPKISGFKKLERVRRVADKIELKPIPIEPIKVEKTLVVVLLDAEDGSFKEASWVENPVKYLPVSKIEAMKLALGEVLDELRIVARKDARDLEVIQQRPTIELVYRDASPYYPDWKITVNGKVFYVSQDGTVSN